RRPSQTAALSADGSAAFSFVVPGPLLSPGANPPTLRPAMSRAPKPPPLTTTQARQIWLHAQRLDERTPFGEGAQAVADATAHLGYVQIDTINVIERCHHHILFSRIPSYRRADLRH